MNDSTLMPRARKSYFKGSGDGVEYTIHIIAPDQTHDNTGWSYKNLDKPIFRARVAQEHASRGVYKVLAPAVATSSMNIGERKDLNTPIYMPYGVLMLRNPDFPLDGVSVDPGEGISGSYAGCGFIVGNGGGILTGTHAGRAGLVGERTIVDSLAEFYKKKGVPLGRVSLRLLFSIDPELFTHPLNHEDPEWAEKNQALAHSLHARYGPEVMRGIEGKLDLDLLFRASAKPYRFREIASSRMIRRGSGFVTTREPGMKDSRNLIILARHR
ncbi:MAG: hypothetical protein JWM39_805 [Parcubacteria group bacterium]|nr:hypothetical protein [Parcubacteria group bacterium]